MNKDAIFGKAIMLLVLCAAPLLTLAGDGDEQEPAYDTTATIWGVFINNTDYCESAPCTEAEVFAEGNPARSDVCYFMGGRVQSNGRATFGGSFAEGSNFGCIYSGYGLESADYTEIHFVAQVHGRLRRLLLTDQVTEFLGGCPPNDCLDVHFAIHVATGEFETVSDVYRFRDGSNVNRATSTLRRMEGGVKAAFDTRFRKNKDYYAIDN